MATQSVTWTTETTNAPLPPLAPGLPLLGNAIEMGGDTVRFLVKMYRQFGPIFRVRALTREFTILAGLPANHFMVKDGDNYLTGEKVFGGLNSELKSTLVFPALDGEKHNYYRRLFRPSYSREAITPHYAAVMDVARNHARTWQVGTRLQVVPTMQRVITDELGTVLTGTISGEVFPDLRDVLRTLIMVKLMKSAPELMLKLPGYKRKKARAAKFMLGILEKHRTTPPEERRDDLVDHALAAVDEHGNSLLLDDLEAIGFGAFFVGMDTAAHTTSFTLYLLLKHPDVLARVVAEVDAVFAKGTPTPKDLRQMKALHGAITESMRLYPVAPIMPRTAKQTFEFGGYRVEKGADVMVVPALTHYLEEYFPNPDAYDVDRSLDKEPYSFAPFGLGAHTCLGAGLAEVMLALTVGTLLHTVRLELDPPDFEMKVVGVPVPNPGMNFYARIAAQR
jgi:cytochrome P450